MFLKKARYPGMAEVRSQNSKVRSYNWGLSGWQCIEVKFAAWTKFKRLENVLCSNGDCDRSSARNVVEIFWLIS